MAFSNNMSWFDRKNPSQNASQDVNDKCTDLKDPWIKHLSSQVSQNESSPTQTIFSTQVSQNESSPSQSIFSTQVSQKESSSSQPIFSTQLSRNVYSQASRSYSPLGSNESETEIESYQELIPIDSVLPNSFNSQQSHAWFTSAQKYSQSQIFSQNEITYSNQHSVSPVSNHSFVVTQTHQNYSQNASQNKTFSDILRDDEEQFQEPEKKFPKILKLKEDMRGKCSDRVFTWVLAGQLCSDSLPSVAYSTLKLSLLMSLVSIGGSSIPIPIAAIGQETSHANIIMNSVGKLADCFVTSTLADFDGLSVNNDEYEAKALLMSKHGVLFLGDWLRLRLKPVSKLLREIETGTVVTEKIQQTVPLECALWTYWSNTKNDKKDLATIHQFIKLVQK